MNYSIFRMQKVHLNNIGNLEMHNERKTENHSNKDINIKLSKNNVQLIECKSYKKAIQNNIDNYYKSDRNIRKDAVIAVETIFTSDYDFFKNKTDKEKELFFEKSLEFLKEFVGEKNIVAATIHYDETTPHMHCVFTPIDNDGKLKYKSFVSHKNDLVKLQDKYHQKMSKYFPELERGKSSKETERKHLTVEEYKIISSPNKIDLENFKKYEKNIQELQTLTNIEPQKVLGGLLGNYSWDEIKIKYEDIEKIKNCVSNIAPEIISSKKILKENLEQKENIEKLEKILTRQENQINVKIAENYDLSKKINQLSKESEENKKVKDFLFEKFPKIKELWKQATKELYPNIEKTNTWKKKIEKDRGWER